MIGLQQGLIRYSPENRSTLKTIEVLTWDGIFVKQILTWYEDEKTDVEILRICELLILNIASKSWTVLTNIWTRTTHHYRQIYEWKEMILSEIHGPIKCAF